MPIDPFYGLPVNDSAILGFWGSARTSVQGIPRGSCSGCATGLPSQPFHTTRALVRRDRDCRLVRGKLCAYTIHCRAVEHSVERADGSCRVVGPVQSSTERGLCRVRVDGMVRSQLMPGLASSECSAGTPALRRARLEPRLQLCYVRHSSDGQSGLRWDALLRLAAYALADWSGFVCISRDADAHRTGAAIRAH